MKRALRCHDFGSGREASRSQYVDIGKVSDKAMSQNSCQPSDVIKYFKACPGVAAKIGDAPERGAGAPLAGCDHVGACESRAFRRSPVPLRGRIQAHNAWNLLRPARDTLSAGLAVWQILSCAVLRVIADFGTQRTRVSLC
jgi:hypothetical protein